MRQLIALYKKEMLGYFSNPAGFIATALFATIASFMFMRDIFLRDSGVIEPFFTVSIWLLIIYIPAIAMKLFSEEKSTNTFEILLTLPMKESTIVIGKFIALCSVCLISLLLTFSIPIFLMLFSQLSISQTAVAYFGLFLVMISYGGLSMFFSSTTTNQIVAYIVSIVVLFFITVLGSDFLLAIFPPAFRSLSYAFSPLLHFENFIKGIVDLKSLTYFISLLSVALLCTTIAIKKRI